MSASKTQILIVEDEIEFSEILRDYLIAANYEVSTEANGAEALARVQKNTPDLIILDRNLPGIDGLEICKQLRTFSNVAIIMLTAKSEEIDRLVGLESGADDYICKPVSPKEVVARTRAVLRRFKHVTPEQKSTELTLNSEYLQAYWQDQNLGLTPVEFRMLDLFTRSHQGIASRTNLLNAAYEDSRMVSERTIDSHIKNLRAKITTQSKISNPIKSVYGVGYQLCIDKHFGEG